MKENNGGYKISEAICEKSGLKFRWVEESMGMGIEYKLALPIHPVFQGDNFLKVERKLVGERFPKMDTTLAAGLIMYRLVSWKVIQPTPQPEMLNRMVEEMGEVLNVDQLQHYYKMCVENFSKNAQRYGEFKFNLDGIDGRDDERVEKGKGKAVRQLCYLISKCSEEQKLALSIEEQAREIKRERIKSEGNRETNTVVERDIEERELGALDKSFLAKKAARAMGYVYNGMNWERAAKKDKEREKQLKRQWKMVQEAIEGESLEYMEEGRKEKMITFAEWGMDKVKLEGKPGKYLRLYLVHIQCTATEWDEEEAGEELEEHEL